MHNTQSHRLHRINCKTCLTIGAALLVLFMLQAPWLQAREGDDARPALRSLSKAVTQVANDAMPAVVFIQVEKLLDAGRVRLATTTRLISFGEEFFAFLRPALSRSAARTPPPAATSAWVFRICLKDLAVSFGIDENGGVLIASVGPDTPAEKAGLIAAVPVLLPGQVCRKILFETNGVR